MILNLIKFIGLLALGLVLTIQAEEEASEVSTPTEEPVISEADLDTGIDVTVTASANRGLEQGILDVPQSVTVITREDLDNMVNNDLHTAIRRQTSIGLAPEGAAQNYWNPGFSIRGLGAQRVLTLTNGVRQAGQGIGYGGGFLSLYDSYAVESIEILRGPRSVVYGTDAIGGVINIQTRRPRDRDEFGINGGVRYEFDGGYDYHRGSAYVDMGGPKVGFVGGFQYTDSSEPNVPGPDRVDEGSYTQFGGWGQVDIKLYDNLTWSFIGNSDHNRDVLVADTTIGLPQLQVTQGRVVAAGPFPPAGTVLAQFPNVANTTTTFSAPLKFDFPEYNRHMAGSEFVFEEAGEPLEYLKAGFYWQQIEREFHRESLFFSGTTAGPASPLSTQVVDTKDEVNVYEWQFISRVNVSDDHKLTSGIDIGYDTSRLPETQTNTVVANPFNGIVTGVPGTLINATAIGSSTTSNLLRADAEQVRFGVFLQDQWTIDRFEITPGVRFDYFTVSDDASGSDASDWGFSGSIASVYKATEETSLYTNLATGFRVPDMGERFQDAIVSIGSPSRVIGNPDLDPERSWSAEIGAKHESEKFSARAALFYNLVEDYITDNTSIGTINGFSTTQFQNVGDVSLYGVEVEVSYNITPDWQVFGNASRTYTNDSNDVNVSDWIFNYGTSYRFNVQNYGIDTIVPSLLMRSAADTEITAGPSAGTFPDREGFTVIDLQIALNTIKTKYGKTKVIGGIHNLTDEEYNEAFFSTLQPERSFYLSVEHQF